MNGIYHKIGARASISKATQALTTREGLSGWWTKQVDGSFSDSTKPGDEIKFIFADKGSFRMKVQSSDTKHVLWECAEGPEDWIGSHIEFTLDDAIASNGDKMTLIYFRHRDWKKESEFTAHCSTKWAVFLLSLRDLLETGKGSPFPEDIKIDEMN